MKRRVKAVTEKPESVEDSVAARLRALQKEIEGERDEALRNPSYVIDDDVMDSFLRRTDSILAEVEAVAREMRANGLAFRDSDFDAFSDFRYFAAHLSEEP